GVRPDDRSPAPGPTPALEANLGLPVATAMTADGELWIADLYEFGVLALDRGGQVRMVAGTGELIGDWPRGGSGPVPALSLSLNVPSDIIIRDGQAYVALFHESSVIRIDIASGLAEVVAGAGERRFTGDGGPAVAANLDLPSHLAFADDGDILLMDQENQA